MSYKRGEKAPRENPPNGDFFVLSHGDFSPRYTKLHDIPCVAFSATVFYLPGGAKGRHAKTRQNHHLAGFRVATFRVFAPTTRWNDMAKISHHNKQIEIVASIGYMHHHVDYTYIYSPGWPAQIRVVPWHTWTPSHTESDEQYRIMQQQFLNILIEFWYL